MFERILDLLTFTYAVPFTRMLEVCFIILALGIIIRHETSLDIIKDWTFTVLGAIGLLYIAIIGAFGDCLLFFVAWFFTVCAASLLELYLSDKWA